MSGGEFFLSAGLILRLIMNCIFCNIANGIDKKNWIFETKKCCCFSDIDPKAPLHFILIPKIHIVSLQDLTNDNIEFIEDMFLSIPKIADKLKISSYRVVSNVGADAGQSVMHLHFHILGGREFGWPPG